jgi:hypothetical protein
VLDPANAGSHHNQSYDAARHAGRNDAAERDASGTAAVDMFLSHFIEQRT